MAYDAAEVSNNHPILKKSVDSWGSFSDDEGDKRHIAARGLQRSEKIELEAGLDALKIHSTERSLHRGGEPQIIITENDFKKIWLLPNPKSNAVEVSAQNKVHLAIPEV